MDPSIPPRESTAREFALIAQSKEDFRLGRTLSSIEVRVSIDEALADLGVPKSTICYFAGASSADLTRATMSGGVRPTSATNTWTSSPVMGETSS